MPTVQRMIYFHAASTDSRFLYVPTKSAETSVVPSIAIQRTARLLAMGTRAIVKTKRLYRR